MAVQLKVLILEDVPADAELAERELRAALKNYKRRVVDNEQDFRRQLDSFGPDLIISDYQLPTFNGLAALKITREKYPFLPFIILTGSMNEDTAVECIKAGADDYVIKEHTKRLGQAALSAIAKKRTEQERHLALQKLRESEQRYRTLYENMVQGVFYQRADGVLVDCNSAALEMFGLTRDQFLGRTSADPRWRVIREDGSDFPWDEHPSMQALRTGKAVHNVVAGVFNPQKEDFAWLTINAIPQFRPGEKKPWQVFVTMHDITSRKQAEEALARERNLLRTLIDNLPDSIYVKDNQSRFLAANLRVARQMGAASPAELLGKTDFDFYAKEMATRYFEDEQEIIRSGQPIISQEELTRDASEGSLKWVLTTKVPLYDHEGKVSGLVGIGHDITYRKRAEMIRLAQYNITRAMVTTPDIKRLAEIIRAELNPVMDTENFILALYDKKNGLLRPKFVADEKDVLPESWPVADTLSGKIVLGKKAVLLKKEDIHRLQRKQNIKLHGTVPQVWLGLPLMADDRVVGVMIFQNYQDASAYARSTVEMLEVIAHGLGIYIARRQIEAERERLSAAIEQAAEVVMITDPDGAIEYVNPAFEKLSGYTRQEALGRNPRFLKSGQHPDALYGDLWQTISSGHTWHGQMVNRSKGGGLFTVEEAISPVFDSAGKIAHYVAVKRDISKELELEEQYRQAQKMESIGRLAGGVAHDFNNMLSVILGYSELILSRMSPDEKLAAAIHEIQKAGQRSAELTSQLLAFARKQTISPRVLDLNDTVGNMLKMLRRLIGEDIDLVWKPGANVWPVKVDPMQINQIMANLAVNARDAISGNGQVIIETDNMIFDEYYSQTHAFAEPGSFVMLAFSDNGCGMDEQVRANIFEPFFTTKPQGEGTGLGLSTVYGIVKQNDGLINVYSEPGKGTTFKIYLPRYSGPEVEEEEVQISALPMGHGEVVLVVEDEGAILDMARLMLESLGYSVLTADSPQKALQEMEHSRKPIDLVISDVIMPQMNGRELVGKMKQKLPRLKTLFMSGYTSNAIAYHGVLDQKVHFISKPFSLQTLAQKVKESLGE